MFNVNRDYVLTDLILDTESPLITGAVTAINDPTTGLLATTVVSPLNALVGEGGGITTLVNGVLAPIEAVLNAIDLGLVFGERVGQRREASRLTPHHSSPQCSKFLRNR